MCFILCSQNFPSSRPLAISFTVSFNGVSADLYALAANSINPSSNSLYLLLNSILPLFTSIAALMPILRQPSPPHPDHPPPPPDAVRRDNLIFLFLNFLAVPNGLYLLLLSSSSSLSLSSSKARFLFYGAIFLLILPLGIPGIIWFHSMLSSCFSIHSSGFLLVDVDDLDLHKEPVSREISIVSSLGKGDASGDGFCKEVMEKDRLVMLGQEHKAGVLVRRLDFWLYYFAYFCGGTIGLVSSNNLGQIAQSLGQVSRTSTLITLSSFSSFLGRLLIRRPGLHAWVCNLIAFFEFSYHFQKI